MTTEPITEHVSRRISDHMNNDHKEAILSFARHYGGIKKPLSARMLGITNKAMKFEVDDSIIQICFPQEITDSEEAHRMIVKMLREIPKSTQ